MEILKTLSRRKTLLAVIFASSLLIFAVISAVSLNSPAQVNSRPPPVVASATIYEKVNYRLPIRLKIPAIGVDAVIEHVGINAKGEMGTPKSPANAAWFNLGPRPGEIGSAVIAGHLDWFNGASALFENLYKLQKGDKLFVEDEGGTNTVFVVRELGSYGKNQDSTSVFRSTDGKSHLNLVTCEGNWNEVQKSYPNRLVVFADKQ